MPTARKSIKPRRGARRTWELQVLPERLARQIAIQVPLPVPGKESARVSRGAIDFGELAQWIEHYLEESPEAPGAEELSAHREALEQLHRSTTLLASGRPAEARAILESLVDKAPSNAIARLNLADCHNVQGEHETALQIADSLAETLGNNLRLLLLRSRAYVALKRRDEAARLLRDAFAGAPTNKTIRHELVRIGELIPVNLDPSRPDGAQFIDRPAYKKKALEQVAKELAGGNPKGAHAVADFLAESRMPEIASEAASLILEKDPADVPALRILGTARMAMGQHEDGEASLRCALAAEPGNLASRLALARALATLDKKNEARELLTAVLAEDANHLPAAESFILLAEGDDAQLEAARELHTKYPESWAVTKLLGDLDFRFGDAPGALARHREAFDKSDSDDALTMVLHDLDRLERLEEAVTLLQAIPRLATRSGSTRWNAANIYLKSGRVKPAVALLENMTRDRALPHDSRLSAMNLLTEIRANVQGRR